MLEHHWISKRLKGLALILLLAGCVQGLHAEEESTTPLIIENIPDSTSDSQSSAKPNASTETTITDVTPATSPTATPAETSGSSDTTVETSGTSALFADTVTKVENFLLDSSSVPEGVKDFVEAHSSQIEWTKTHPLHINAFALVFAILCRMCCGDSPRVVKPRKPQPMNAPHPAAPKSQTAAAPAKPAKPAKTAADPEPEKNPFQRVLEETLKSPVTPARDTFIVQSYLRWAAAEPQPAYKWAAGVEDTALGRKLLTDALLAEEEKDAAAAFDLALNTLPPEHQDGIIDAIVRQWSRKKPEAAAEKIATIPSSSPVLQTAISALVETWVSLDIEAAHQWVTTLPINLFRDLTLSVFIQQLMHQSPESAAAWVESIANDQVRQQVAGIVAQKWQAVDPEAANAWLEKANA